MQITMYCEEWYTTPHYSGKQDAGNLIQVEVPTYIHKVAKCLVVLGYLMKLCGKFTAEHARERILKIA